MTIVYGINLPVTTNHDEGYFFEGQAFYKKLFLNKEEAKKFALSKTIDALFKANDYGLDESESDAIIAFINEYKIINKGNMITCKYEDYELVYKDGSVEVDLKYVIEKTNILDGYLESLYEILELEVPEHKHYKWDDIR